MALIVQKQRKNILVNLFATFFVVLLISQGIVAQYVNAVAGVANKLSYQGRLTNNSGAPLTNTYCVRYSIYDTESAGTKLWPAGTPTATSTIVSNGIFNAPVGEMDSLATYDFSANSTEYLNVEVNTTPVTCGGTWESLSPRQSLNATAYARVAADVYGTALRTSSTRVQAGAGTGQATPIFTRFDNQNTAATIGGACPGTAVNGDMWYNSNNGKLLACNSSIIQVMSLLGNQFFDVAGPTVARTFTFPDSSATVLTSASAVTAGQGGTGQAGGYAIGDLLYASGASTLSKLADVAAGSYLRSGGVTTAPVWSTATLPNTTAQGDLLYSSATNVVSTLAKDINATRYLSNTGATNNPAWAAVSLTSGVTGILPAQRGGTGMAFFTVAGPTVLRNFTFPDADATVLTSGAAVTVAQGGTGATTLTGIPVGTGTGAFTAVAGTASQYLRRNAGDTAYEFATIAGGGSNALLDGSSHTDTAAGTVARGDVITGQTATPKWTRLAKGTANQVLSMDGTATDVVWATPTGGGAPTTATYITQTADAGLSAEQALSALATGPLRNTTTTGVLTVGNTSLTSEVTGILPTANGGTGMAFFTVAGPTVARIFTFPDAAATVLTSNAAVTVAQGGTGLNASVSDAVLVGDSTSAYTARALPASCAGTTAKLLYDSTTNLFSCGTDQTSAGGTTYVVKTADTASTASTAYQNITNLSWALAASTRYDIECKILYSASVNTIGLGIGWTGPASPLITSGRMVSGITTATVGGTVSVGNDTGAVTTASVATTGNHAFFTGFWSNGTTAGTLQMRFKPETATASGITIKAGSWCKYSTY